MTEPQIHHYNGPVLTEDDRRAHKSWATNGTVDQQYIISVLGDPAENVQFCRRSGHPSRR